MDNFKDLMDAFEQSGIWTKTKKMSKVKHQKGPDLNKIWKGKPSKIDGRVKEIFLEYLKKTDGKGNYANKLIGMPNPDLGLTLEWLYRQEVWDHPVKPNPLKSTMSEECRVWAGLDRLDPCVNMVWSIPNSVHDGCLHGWAYLSKMRRSTQIKYIEEMEVVNSCVLQ